MKYRKLITRRLERCILKMSPSKKKIVKSCIAAISIFLSIFFITLFIDLVFMNYFGFFDIFGVLGLGLIPLCVFGAIMLNVILIVELFDLYPEN